MVAETTRGAGRFETNGWGSPVKRNGERREPMAIVPTDDVVSLLAQDHEAIRERLKELESARPERRAELFRELTAQLVRHEKAEEMVVYPAVRQEPGGDSITKERVAEESEAEQLLARMEKLDPTTEEFMGAMRDLATAVSSHAAKEEEEVFPLLLAHEDTAYLEMLGQKFKGEKLAAPTHPHPHAPHSTLGSLVVGPVASFVDRLRDSASLANNSFSDRNVG
jgi:hemerythrin superfamily protein